MQLLEVMYVNFSSPACTASSMYIAILVEKTIKLNENQYLVIVAFICLEKKLKKKKNRKRE